MTRPIIMQSANSVTNFTPGRRVSRSFEELARDKKDIKVVEDIVPATEGKDKQLVSRSFLPHFLWVYVRKKVSSFLVFFFYRCLVCCCTYLKYTPSNFLPCRTHTHTQRKAEYTSPPRSRRPVSRRAAEEVEEEEDEESVLRDEEVCSHVVDSRVGLYGDDACF